MICGFGAPSSAIHSVEREWEIREIAAIVQYQNEYQNPNVVVVV